MRSLRKAVALLACAAHLTLATAATSTTALAAGSHTLPSPYVSRAFDAVLLPIDESVRSAFSLDPAETGVFVLAVEPGGVADQQGVAPGDVISEVKGHAIADPIQLDEVVYYWLGKGTTDFGYTYYRAGKPTRAKTSITLEQYTTVIEMAAVASWVSWSVDASFSYSEFYSEYSEELTASYESSETTIETESASAEFDSAVDEEATADEAEATDDAATDDGASDDAATDDGSDGTADDSAGDDAGGDDGGGDAQ
jgi:hypothetical protein